MLDQQNRLEVDATEILLLENQTTQQFGGDIGDDLWGQTDPTRLVQRLNNNEDVVVILDETLSEVQKHHESNGYGAQMAKDSNELSNELDR